MGGLIKHPFLPIFLYDNDFLWCILSVAEDWNHSIDKKGHTKQTT